MLISIIIATHNRCESLKAVLDGLLIQKIPEGVDYEVVVVDNNSKDKTSLTVSEYQTRFSGRLHYFLEPTKGKCHALNLGLREAKGETVVFTDDDVVLQERWLSQTMDCYRKHDCDAVAGRVLPIYPPQTPSWIKSHAVKLSGAVVIYDYGLGTFRLQEAKDRFIGANCSVKRSVAVEIGGFRTDIGPGQEAAGEDAEFYNRLIASNKSIYYCGESIVWHPFDPSRLTLKHMAKWNMQVGRYYALTDIEKGNHFVSYFGVPRYLFRGILSDCLRLTASCLDRPGFLIAWRDLFCKIGAVQWHQKFHLKPAGASCGP